MTLLIALVGGLVGVRLYCPCGRHKSSETAPWCAHFIGKLEKKSVFCGASECESPSSDGEKQMFDV